MLSAGEDLDLQATKPRKYLANRAAIMVAIPQDGRTTDRRKRGTQTIRIPSQGALVAAFTR